MDEGFSVLVVERELVVQDSALPRGTLIARVERIPESLHARIDSVGTRSPARSERQSHQQLWRGSRKNGGSDPNGRTLRLDGPVGWYQVVPTRAGFRTA